MAISQFALADSRLILDIISSTALVLVMPDAESLVLVTKVFRVSFVTRSSTELHACEI